MDLFIFFILFFIILFIAKVWITVHKGKEGFKNRENMKNKKEDKKTKSKTDSNEEPPFIQTGDASELMDNLMDNVNDFKNLDEVYQRNTTGPLFNLNLSNINGPIPFMSTSTMIPDIDASIPTPIGDIPIPVGDLIIEPMNTILEPIFEVVNKMISILNAFIYFSGCIFHVIKSFFIGVFTETKGPAYFFAFPSPIDIINNVFDQDIGNGTHYSWTGPCVYWYFLYIILKVLYLPFFFLFWILGINELVNDFLWAPIYILNDMLREAIGVQFAHFPDIVNNGCFSCNNTIIGEAEEIIEQVSELVNVIEESVD
jgi:hypothetical protein